MLLTPNWDEYGKWAYRTQSVRRISPREAPVCQHDWLLRMGCSLVIWCLKPCLRPFREYQAAARSWPAVELVSTSPGGALQTLSGTGTAIVAVEGMVAAFATANEECCRA
jgi:hypothetical protein